MRRPGLLVFAVAASAAAGCSGPQEGAVLTILVPQGPAVATRIEIVLASADLQTLSTIAGQRLQPTSLQEETVRYYRQRAIGGVIDVGGSLDHLDVRIEPNLAEVPDQRFVPFVLAYQDQTLAAIGTIADAQGDPAAATIEPGSTHLYTVTMFPVTAANADVGISTGEALVVSCDPGGWPSGVAWRSAAGAELRLLLPDRSVDAMATDASAREADLDCDQHVAASGDCDDLRAAFHAGAAETCDGLDSNCDGRNLQVLSCPSSSACGGPGVQVCDESTSTSTTCGVPAACACTTAANNCTRCVFDHLTVSDPLMTTICAPAVGHLSLDAICNANLPCTIEVAGTTGPFRALVAATDDGPFANSVTGIHGSVSIEAKPESGGPVTAADGASVGAVYLRISTTGASQVLAVDLQLAPARADQCTTLGSGTMTMVCTP